MPCTVVLYSFTAASWQFAQLTGFNVSACGILSAATSVWQSVHLRLNSPCTDVVNFGPSTAIDLPAVPLASAAAWHARQVSLTFGAAAGVAAGFAFADAASPMHTRAQRVRSMVAVVMRIPCGFGCFAGAEGPARFFSPPERIVASTTAGGVDGDQARTEGDD